jgi:hypothetical protein
MRACHSSALHCKLFGETLICIDAFLRCPLQHKIAELSAEAAGSAI